MNLKKTIIKSIIFLKKKYPYAWSFLAKNFLLSAPYPKAPFDIVITWVDWTNKYFLEQMIAAGGRSEGCESGEFIELKYLLRSIEKQKIPYRYIHIVHSDSHPPPKYLKETEKLFFVPHSKLVRDPTHLPLIHRESITSHLHRIPNLAEHFFYIEDDLLILDKRIFFNKLYDFHHKKIKVFYRKLKLKYDVIKSEGLWFQSTINAHRLVLGNQFNEQNYGDSIFFDHAILLFNKKILKEIEKAYPTQFLATASYQNQKKEGNKEDNLICLVALYNNYLVHHLNFKPSEHPFYFVTRVHTNGISDDSTEKIEVFKKKLLETKKYLSANFQGNGISDEYPECKKIRTLYMDWLNTEFPTPTPFEVKP